MKATAELEGNDSLLNGSNELPEDKNVCGENAKTQSFSYWLVANRNSSTAYVISPLDTRHKDEHKEEANRDSKSFLPNDKKVKNKKTAIKGCKTKKSQEDKASLICHVCDKQLNSKYLLQRHLAVHTGKRSYQCKICTKWFYSQAELTSHGKFHLKIKAHKCNVCDKRFAHSTDLTRHIRIHTGEKPYKCEICGRGFALSPDVVKHMRTHTGERPYECRICGERFAQSSTLYNHKQVHIKEGFIL